MVTSSSSRALRIGVLGAARIARLFVEAVRVLCERPRAANGAAARAMFKAAESNGVYLVEAYPYRAQPQTLKVRELIAAGVVGRIQLIQASFGFPLADAANIRMDPNLSGGALMDAGSYPVSFVRTVAGAAPARVSSTSRLGPTGVDVTTMATLEHPEGLLAQISCSFTTARHRHAMNVGDARSISTTYFNDAGPDFPPLVDVRLGSGWDAQHDLIETEARLGFLAEAESFHDLVRYGWNGWTGATPAESIDTALTLDALAASSRQGVPVEVGVRS